MGLGLRTVIVGVIIVLLATLIGACGSSPGTSTTTTVAPQTTTSAAQAGQPSAAQYKALFDQWNQVLAQLPDINVMDQVSDESAATNTSKVSAADIANAKQTVTTVAGLISAVQAVKAPAEYTEVHSSLLDMLQAMKDLVGSVASSAEDGATVQELQSKFGATNTAFMQTVLTFVRKATAAGLVPFGEAEPEETTTGSS